MARIRRGSFKALLSLVMVAMTLLAPAAAMLAQSSSSSASWAVPGNVFTYSLSDGISYPGQPAVSTSTTGTLTLTVQSVSGTTFTLEESVSGSLMSNTISGNLNSPSPSNSGGLYLYIPPAQLQTTLQGLVSSFEQGIQVPVTNFTITPTVSEKTVSTGVGDVGTWTLDVNGNGYTQSSGTTLQGSGTASVSYDSQLGLLVAAHVRASGGITGSSLNGPVSFNVDLTLTGKPSSVHLTSGGGLAGLSASSWEIIIVVVAAVTVVVAAVIVMSRGKPKAQGAVPAPAEPSPPATT